MDCGKLGWNEPSHPCRTKRDGNTAGNSKKLPEPLDRAALQSETGKVLLTLSSFSKDDSEELLYDGLMNDHKVVINVDSGASHIFASRRTARYCGLDVYEDESEVELGDRSTISVEGKSVGRLKLDGNSADEVIYLVPE